MQKIIDAQRQEVEQAIGHFILDLGMIEATMIQALAALTGVPPTQAHFLLNKTGGGQKADLLKDAALARGIDLKSTGLKGALGTIQDIMNFRNRLVHDPIGFHWKSQRWVRGQGTPDGDKVFGKTAEINSKEIYDMGKKAWEAIKIIGFEILEKHGGFIYRP